MKTIHTTTPRGGYYSAAYGAVSAPMRTGDESAAISGATPGVDW